MNALGFIDDEGFYNLPPQFVPQTDINPNSFARYVDDDNMRASLAPDFNGRMVTFNIKGVTNLVLLDPGLIRRCFVENPGNYGYSPVRQRILKPIFGEGLLVAEGDNWKTSRKAISNVFSAARLEDYSATMHQSCIQYLESHIPSDQPIPISDYLSRLTFRILSNSLFSGDLSGDEDELLEAISRIMDSFDGDNRVDIGLAAYWLPKSKRVANSPAIKKCRRILARIIKERLEKPAQAGARNSDILSNMIDKMSGVVPAGEFPKYLEDNIMSFLIPGHETSAIAVSWTLFILSQSPDDLQRARQEADELYEGQVPAAKWHEKADFLRSCVEEAMRLYPPLPLLARYAIGDDRYEDMEIPAGSVVMVSTGLLHRQHRLWPDPAVFRPARFAAKNRAEVPRYGYLPFGIGPKTCIGAGFALREAVIVLGEFIRNFDFAYADSQAPGPVMRVVTRPDNKIPMVIRPRNSASW